MNHETRARSLFERMLRQESVWVDSPAGQEVKIEMIAWEDGSLIAFDDEGSDRPVTSYLVAKPRSEEEPCTAFEWKGQPITSCDNCGRPAWDHDYDQRYKSPFGSPAINVRWSPDLVQNWHNKGYISAERTRELLMVGSNNE